MSYQSVASSTALTLEASPDLDGSTSHDVVSFVDDMVAADLLTLAQAGVIKKEQALSNTTLRDAVIHSGFISEKKYLSWAASCENVPFFEINQVAPLIELLTIYSGLADDQKTLLFRENSCVIKEKENGLEIGITDPIDHSLKTRISAAFHPTPVSFVGLLEKDLANLNAQLNTNYGALHEPSLGEQADQDPSSELSKILEEAILRGASDIHFCPKHPSVSIKFRIDGDLVDARLRHISEWPSLLSQLKVLSKMRIEEKNLPQFGRFTSYIQGRHIDFRSSSHPTTDGENFVVRALDRMQSLRELDELGFSKSEIDIIKAQLRRPHGMIIMTGPTGSGKTTTLYSMLSYLKDYDRNIMTLEDPVEYLIPNIRQTQVKDTIGLDFATGIRSLLRQNPDVILIGEIRDEETARMALRAAMTGHLVLTTLHTNSCLSATRRLLELGVPAGLLSGNINCILSQRLIKRPLKRSRGFQENRLPIVEILPVSAQLDRLLTENASYYDLLTCAQSEGFVTMSEKARQRIEKGEFLQEDVQKLLAV